MNILITGGAGFIGRHLCKKMLEENNNVWCLDNLQTSTFDNIEDFMMYPNFTFIKMDVLNFNNEISDNYFKNVHIDQIYHLACPASPEFYQATPIHTLSTCFIGTKNILDFALKKKSRVLFTSTSEVYGDPTVHPQPESYSGNVNTTSIRSCYDEGKRVAETLTIEYHRVHSLEVRIARIFNTYGPYLNSSDGRVISNFVYQALKNLPITVYGDGTQTRSFCYVDDTVIGLIKLMNNNNCELNLQPINIGNQHEISILDLAKIIVELIKSASEIVFKDLPKDDPKIRCPHTQKANDIIDWRPTIPLNDGLKLTIEAFKKNQ
jgi:UDP-glucuronate decarboxylase